MESYNLKNLFISRLSTGPLWDKIPLDMSMGNGYNTLVIGQAVTLSQGQNPMARGQLTPAFSTPLPIVFNGILTSFIHLGSYNG